jgi:hypothetical protein
MRPAPIGGLPRKYRSVQRRDPIDVAVPFRLRRFPACSKAPDSSAPAFPHAGPCTGSAGTGPLAGWSVGSVSTVDTSATAGDVRSWRRDGEPKSFTRSAVWGQFAEQLGREAVPSTIPTIRRDRPSCFCRVP